MAIILNVSFNNTIYDMKKKGSDFLLKLGIGLVIIGLLIVLLDWLIIYFLASIFIAMGIFLIVMVFAEEKHIWISLVYVKEMELYKVQLMHLIKAQ